LIVLSVVEVVLVIGVLAYYLIQISNSLNETSRVLAKITFGVRAVETQCSTIGPNVVRINEQLTTIAGAVGGVADKAEAIADSA
jgi:methyl-accepting chemotaxis protein